MSGGCFLQCCVKAPRRRHLTRGNLSRVMASVTEHLPVPTQEGGGVYVNGFPSGPKPYEEVLTFLRKGTELLKYGRIGVPKYHPFRLSNDDLELQWESKKGLVRRVPLQRITRWQRGQETPVFRKHPQPKAANRSFSIYYIDAKGRELTLDVICNTVNEFEMWYWGVQIIRYYPPHTWSAPTPTQLPGAQPYSSSIVPVPVGSQNSAPARQPTHAPPGVEVPPARAAPADDRVQRPTPKMKAAAAGLTISVGSRPGPVPGAPLAMRRDRRELGDLYVWGSLLTHEDDEWAAKNPPPGLYTEAMREWQQSSKPVLVQNAGSVDVVRVACAPRHAALITRKGELYTWGVGTNGNLGHGWCTNHASPRLVTRMSGKGVRAVACGEGATAAISADMQLFMWGAGTAGQLGNGYTFPMAEPAPVVFPGMREGVRVLAVSCGPYHTAAITEGGHLFTWGSGLFGRLGHGTHASEYRPRRVAALEDMYVTCVSCGYWHTAAVATPRNSITRAQSNNQADLPTPASTVPNCFASSAPPAAAPNHQHHRSQPSQSQYPPHPQSNSSPMPPPSNGSSITVAGGISAAAGTAGGAGGGQDGSVGGPVRLLTAASDVSSSGSDLQAVIATANAAAAANAARNAAGGMSYGGADVMANGSNGNSGNNGNTSGGQALLGPVRSDLMSSSVASLDQLHDGAAEEMPVAALMAGGGLLYTWGGDSSWTEPAEVATKRGGEHVPPKRDHHGGCLGHGDKEGRLVPTRVRGDLDRLGVVQVACGWSMTIALSLDGRVYQMGSTGAPKSGEKSCAWEGALAPTRVDGNLFGMFVEEVACGMHHVVVVASKVQANGQIPEDQRRVRLLSWGRGAEGQLGLDGGSGSASGEGSLQQRVAVAQVDHSLPQIVTAVDGKRVLHVSAGGNHTMAVLEHDPRTRRSHQTPLMSAATPTHPYGNAAAATPSAGGGGGFARPASYAAMYHSAAGSSSMILREGRDGGAGNGGGGGGMGSLLSMSSPFQLTNSLPITAAAAALQQMVASSVGGTRGKPSLAGSDSSRTTHGTARRHQSSRLVAIPVAPSQSSSARVEHSHHHHHHPRSDLRRSATRLQHSGGQAGGASGPAPGLPKSASMSAHLGKVLDPAASVSSSIMSHRSSQPLAKGDEGDSRSVSPTSSSLYDMGSTTGDFHSQGNLARHAMQPQAARFAPPHANATSLRGAAGAAAASAAASGAAAGAVAVPASGHPGRAGSISSAAGGVVMNGGVGGGAVRHGGAAAGGSGAAGEYSLGGHSAAATETDGDTDSYFQGGRSLDMVPEQSEESPSSPACRLSRHSHLVAGSTAHPPHPAATTAAAAAPPPPHPQHLLGLAGGAGAGAMESPPPPPAGMAGVHAHPRVALLSRSGGGGGGTAGGGGGMGNAELLRASVSTMDSSYTGASSSGMSPSGMGTPSPGVPGGPYILPDEPVLSSPPPPPPQPPLQHMPYTSEHMQQQQQQPLAPGAATAPAAAAAGPSFSRAPQDMLQSARNSQAHMSAVAPPSGAYNVRSREISISVWAQQPQSSAPNSATATAAAAAVAAGGVGGVDGLAPALQHRGGSNDMGGRASGGVRGGGGGGSNRGSRGHSRTTSYDSIDMGSAREAADAHHLHQRPGSIAAIDTTALPATAAGVPLTPSRITSSISLQPPPPPPPPSIAAPEATNAALRQQNEYLQQQVEALRQHLALVAQAAGLGAAAGAPAGGLGYPPPLPPAAAAASAAPQTSGAAGLHTTLHPGPGGAAAAAAAAGFTGSGSGTPTAGAAVAGADGGLMVLMSPNAGVGGVLPPPPLPPQPPGMQHLHHTSSVTLPTSTSGGSTASYIQQQQQQHALPAAPPPPSPQGHGLPPLGPSGGGRGSVSSAVVHGAAADRGQVPGPAAQLGTVTSVAAAPPIPSAAAAVAAPGRHRRSTSVDFMSLIATRDGIGPAKDYLAPAVQQQQQLLQVGSSSRAASGSGGSGGGGGGGGGAGGGQLIRDGSNPMGHHTAPSALESLRHAHAGLSLAQAALAEADEDEEEATEDEEEDEEEEDEVDGEAEGDVGAAELEDPDHASAACLPPPPVAVAAAMSLATQGSVRRQAYVTQRQQLQARTAGPHGYEVHPSDPRVHPGSSAIPVDARDYFSSSSSLCSSDDPAAVAEPLDAAVTQGRNSSSRRNAAVQAMQQPQQYPQHHPQQQPQQQQQQHVNHHYQQHPQQPQQHAVGGGGSSLVGQQHAGAPPAGGESVVRQYAQGVYITLRPPQQPGGRVELCKLRFSRRIFSQQEAQQWWAAHKAELYDQYYVTASVGGGGGTSRTTTPSAFPTSPATAAQPPPASHNTSMQHQHHQHQHQHSAPSGSQLSSLAATATAPLMVSHTRGPSVDTQGTSVGSGGNHFQLAATSSASPVHGHAGKGGSGGSAAGYPLGPAHDSVGGGGRGSSASAVAYWPANAVAPPSGGDPYASWADQTYDDAASLAAAQSLLLAAGLGGAGSAAAAAAAAASRHKRSRSGSRNASGGAGVGAAGPSALPPQLLTQQLLPPPPQHLQQQPLQQHFPQQPQQQWAAPREGAALMSSQRVGLHAGTVAAAPGLGSVSSAAAGAAAAAAVLNTLHKRSRSSEAASVLSVPSTRS
ncbi:hypothetical protein Agub_g7811 [Astrephomene gubernaculifera]|uniref:BRX domain-containing protein n=1 Tax=Astrephomene gubernaculifera TaxID=47775 RepID=A0AAD3DQM6_9CHLO|nr:hypothetical protein Agub_g7811 [Astrephomene gubernaculifera]